MPAERQIEDFLCKRASSTPQFKNCHSRLEATVFDEVLCGRTFVPVLFVLFTTESVVEGSDFLLGEEPSWHLDVFLPQWL